MEEMEVQRENWKSAWSWVYQLSTFPYDIHDADNKCSMFWKAVGKFLLWFGVVGPLVGMILGILGGEMYTKPIIFVYVIGGFLGIGVVVLTIISVIALSSKQKEKNSEIYQVVHTFKEKHCKKIRYI